MRHEILAKSGRVHAVTVIVVATLLTSCTAGGGQEPPMTTTTITQAEAERKVEDYVRQAAQALSTDIRLEVIGSSTAPCTDPSDNGPQGRVFASNRYWVRGLPRERNEQSVQGLLRWSQQQGFTVQADEWAKSKFITLEKGTDGFRMAIQESSAGDLSIGASSPCVWPNGTPEPELR